MDVHILRYKPDLLRGNIDWMLLSLLREEPMYGYQLIKEAGKKSKGYFRFREGMVYSALHRLEKEELVQGEWQYLPDGQERRYYHITVKGELALKQRKGIWRGFTTAVNLVLRPDKL